MLPPTTLTGHLRDKGSPVDQFLRSITPNLKRFLKEPREQVRGVHAEGKAILPSLNREEYPYTHIGMAIDYRIRYYFEVRDRPPLGGARGVPFDDASEFFDELALLAEKLAPPQKWLEQQDEDALNRFCIALGHLDAVSRGFATLADIRCDSAMELVDRPQDFWLDDMRAMSWTFYDECNHLLPCPSIMNPSFPGLACDADLIVGGILIEIKTSKKPIIHGDWLRQLLGYALLDTLDEYGIDSIGLYLPRQGRFFEWKLEKALQELCGRSSPSLHEMRRRFKSMLDFDLREYEAECMARHYEDP